MTIENTTGMQLKYEEYDSQKTSKNICPKKRKFSDVDLSTVQRIRKKVKPSTSSVNVTFNIPEGVSFGRFVLDLVIEKEESNKLLIDYSEEYEKVDPDVTIQLDQGKTIFAHRKALSVSSMYFSNMFSSRWKTKNTYRLRGVEPKHAQAIIQYFYTKEIELSLATYPWVIDMANLWGIDRLERGCELFLKQYYHPNKWTRFLEHGEIYEDLVVDYIVKNATKIFMTNEIAQLPERVFYRVLNHEELTVKSEYHIFEAICIWIESRIEGTECTLKDYIKTNKLCGRPFFELVRFEEMTPRTVVKKIGKRDVFSVYELNQMTQTNSGYRWVTKPRGNVEKYLYPRKFEDGQNVKNHARFDDPKSITFIRIPHFTSSSGEVEEIQVSQFGTDLRFAVNPVFVDEKLKLKIILVSGFADLDQIITMRVTMINQYDARENCCGNVKVDFTEIESDDHQVSVDLMSEFEVKAIDCGWVVNDTAYLAIKWLS